MSASHSPCRTVHSASSASVGLRFHQRLPVVPALQRPEVEAGVGQQRVLVGTERVAGRAPRPAGRTRTATHRGTPPSARASSGRPRGGCTSPVMSSRGDASRGRGRTEPDAAASSARRAGSRAPGSRARRRRRRAPPSGTARAARVRSGPSRPSPSAHAPRATRRCCRRWPTRPTSARHGLLEMRRPPGAEHLDHLSARTPFDRDALVDVHASFTALRSRVESTVTVSDLARIERETLRYLDTTRRHKGRRSGPIREQVGSLQRGHPRSRVTEAPWLPQSATTRQHGRSPS